MRFALGVVLVAALLGCAVPAPSRAAERWTWPLVGEVITPYRNGDDPYAAGQHRGIDIAGEVGDSVVAAVGGRVTFSGRAGSSGLTVTVRTSGGRYDTSYLHLSSVAVRKGGTVARGGRIGAVGTTGRRSAQRPHLHFGVRDAGTRHAYHDPLAFLPPPPAARRPGGPRGAPAPAPAPVRPAPVPAPARPVRAPAGRRAPSGRRAPAPHPGSAPALSPAPHVHPVPHTRAGPGPVPARRHSQGRAPAREAVPRPSLGPAPSPAPSGAAAATRRSPAEPSRTGPDLGWAIACAGLLLAAALLGGSQEGRSAASRGRERLAGLLRPLTGRA